MRNVYLILISIVTTLIAGCATTSTQVYPLSEKTTICSGSGNNFGYIAVLPETAWRGNQKEPAVRELMALEEIRKAFKDFPCGDISAPGGVREFYTWSRKPESELLKEFSNQGVDTIIILRLEEFTPLLSITFSLPFLWWGSNQVDLYIKMLSVKTGEALIDMRVKRTTGGPFNIRPAEWSRKELQGALHDLI